MIIKLKDACKRLTHLFYKSLYGWSDLIVTYIFRRPNYRAFKMHITYNKEIYVKHVNLWHVTLEYKWFTKTLYLLSTQMFASLLYVKLSDDL